MTTKTNNAQEATMKARIGDVRNKAEVYFKGDLATFTGETEVLYGALFAVAVVEEVHRKGHTIHIRVDERDVIRGQVILDIARKELFLHTLETQACGDDFQEQAVWSIRKALELAYEAGRVSK